MNTEHILVPFYRHSSDLEALYHSFSLAERIRAKIFVLFFRDEPDGQNSAPMETACHRIVNTACEEGIPVSFHLAGDRFETELVNFVHEEHIGLIVVSPKDRQMEDALKYLRPKIAAKVVKVAKKKITPHQKR